MIYFIVQLFTYIILRTFSSLVLTSDGDKMDMNIIKFLPSKNVHSGGDSNICQSQESLTRSKRNLGHVGESREILFC